MFDNWRKSGHAQILAQNINDPAGHWTVTGCASCHSVGYDTAATAVNGGFDDNLGSPAWAPPAGKASNYADMFLSSASAAAQKLATLANVQCENCHGPNNSPAHGKGGANTPQRVSFSAGVCGSCHGEPLRHGRYQQWQTSKHSNFATALGEGAAENRAVSATSPGVANCARCHSAQGFVAWIEQATTPAVGLNQYLQGASGNATQTELLAMGLNKAEVQPQTCATCHEPHHQGTTSSEPNTAMVRLEGTVPVTAGGFGATGVGHGAVCIACHNSRNGLHNDQTTPTAAFDTPHDGPQSDVLLGQNAYFVNVGARGGHSYITNTCTNCHMQLTPPPALLSYQQSGTNHSFKADLTICTNCHGQFDGGTLQASTTQSLADLATKLSAGLTKRLQNTTTMWATVRNVTTSKSSPASSIMLTGANITSVTYPPTGGSTVTVTVSVPVVDNWSSTTTTTNLSSFTVSLSALKVDDGTGTAAGTALVVPNSTNAYRAIWNFMLINNDQSMGVHNPGFVKDVINATVTKDLSI
jgi:hypothetical protein